MPPSTDTLEYLPAVSARSRAGTVVSAPAATGAVRLATTAVSPVLVVLESPSARRRPPASPARLASIHHFSPEPPLDAA